MRTDQASVRGESVLINDPKDGWAWEFDTTFLLSRYECTWGAGCPSIRNDGTDHGCCTRAVHLRDNQATDDLELITGRVAQLTDDDWQNRQVALARSGGPEGWARAMGAHDVKTRIHKGACIFHNRADHPGGAGCALHAAALNRGEDYIDWKPSICWMVPFFVDHDAERNVRVLRVVRDYHWGEVEWWCAEDAANYSGDRPAYVTMEPELRRIAGDAVYDELCGYLRRYRVELPTDTPIGKIALPMHP